MGSFDRMPRPARPRVCVADKVGIRGDLGRHATEITGRLGITACDGLPLGRSAEGPSPARSRSRPVVAPTYRLPQSWQSGAWQAMILCGAGDLGVDGWVKPSHGSVC